MKGSISPSVNLGFYGGVGTVTGSKYLLQAGGQRILVDCGIFQGLKHLRDRNWQEMPFRPADIDVVIVTHAHIDHSGYLPRLVKLGFTGPIYCSEGTAKLLEILLPDAGRLQEEEADHRNRHGLTRHSPAKPLYDEQDAYDALRQLRPVKGADAEIDIFRENGSHITARFMNAGHIIGSRFVLVDIQEKSPIEARTRILFSGDIGQYDRPILPDPVPPPECDYILVESTYGDRLHPTAPPQEALAKIINETAKRHGTVLIPAFAVDRTQELIYMIRELEDAGKIPVLPVYVDSPMAASACEVYAELRSEQDAEYRKLEASHRHPLSTRKMVIASSRDESRKVNDAENPCIILSAAGMMTGGRVLHHAQRILPDHKSTIVFAGYQGEGTTGRLIKDGAREVTIYKTHCPVHCHVAVVDGLSSHADWKDTLRWLSGMPSAPKTVFITHGEQHAAEALQEHIQAKFGWPSIVPQMGDKYELGPQ
jgi:metallo-beta-lactamase family protein